MHRFSVFNPAKQIGEFTHFRTHGHDEVFGVVKLMPVPFTDKTGYGPFEIGESGQIVGWHRRSEVLRRKYRLESLAGLLK